MRFDFTDPEYKKKPAFFNKNRVSTNSKDNKVLPKNHIAKRDRFQELLNKKRKESKKGVFFNLNLFKKERKEDSKSKNLSSIIKDKFTKTKKISNKEDNNKKVKKIENELSNIFTQKKDLSDNKVQSKERAKELQEQLTNIFAKLESNIKDKSETKNIIKEKFSKNSENPEQKLKEIFARLEENRKKYEEKKRVKRLTKEQSDEFLKIFEDIQSKGKQTKDEEEIKKNFEDEVLESFIKQRSELKVAKRVSNRLIDYKSFYFSAKIGDFFRVWFVNILLTIFTFGGAYPLAKQRIKEYLFNSTILDGSNFEYRLNIKSLIDTSVFIALMLFVSFGLYYLEMPLYYLLAPALLTAFASPWIAYKNLKSNIDALSYRNVYFKYVGKNLTQYYKLTTLYFGVIFMPTLILIGASIYFYNNLAYALSAILVTVATLYFVAIFIFLSSKLYNRYQDLIINRTYFGINRFYFDTSVNIDTLFKKFLPIALATTLVVAILSALIYTNFIGLFTIDTTLKYILIFIISFIGINFFLGTLQGYLQNFTLNNTTLKGYSIKSHLKPIKFGAIKFVNSILLIFTLGLAYPYTKIKELKYRLSHTQFECEDCNEFIESSI